MEMMHGAVALARPHIQLVARDQRSGQIALGRLHSVAKIHPVREIGGYR